jgi:hypothetical protein
VGGIVVRRVKNGTVDGASARNSFGFDPAIEHNPVDENIVEQVT